MNSRNASTRSVGLACLLVAGLCGCSARRSGPPAAVAASPAPSTGVPIAAHTPAPPGHDDTSIPLCIQRLVREQKDEIHDLTALASVVRDTGGRTRALGDVQAVATELDAIERALVPPESDRLDEAATKLLQLESKIALLHESLRQAHPEPGSPKIPD